MALDVANSARSIADFPGSHLKTASGYSQRKVVVKIVVGQSLQNQIIASIKS